MTSLKEIKGLRDLNAEQLRAAGTTSVQSLRERGATPAGRKELAASLNISEQQVLEWVNRADLHRIKGIGEEYSDLLENAGVDTVAELAQRNPANLSAKLAEVNAAHNLVRRLPTPKQVEDWVAQAKALPRGINY